MTIRPRDAGTRPVIVSTASTALQLTGPGATRRGLDLQPGQHRWHGHLRPRLRSQISNVVSISNGDTPCQMSNGRMTDTICLATAASGQGPASQPQRRNVTTVDRNATLFATGSNGTGSTRPAHSGASVSLDVASSIVAGGRLRHRDGYEHRRLRRRRPGGLELRDPRSRRRRDGHAADERRQPDRGSDLHRLRSRAGARTPRRSMRAWSTTRPATPTSTGMRDLRASATISAPTSCPTRSRRRRRSRRSRSDGRVRGVRSSFSPPTSRARISSASSIRAATRSVRRR